MKWAVVVRNRAGRVTCFTGGAHTHAQRCRQTDSTTAQQRRFAVLLQEAHRGGCSPPPLHPCSP